jgi:hypothetical protein
MKDPAIFVSTWKLPTYLRKQSDPSYSVDFRFTANQLILSELAVSVCAHVPSSFSWFFH